MRISDWSSDVCSSDLAAAGQLAPQDGREGEADEVVEGAARHVGVDQLLVEAARVLESLDHRLLGDLVEIGRASCRERVGPVRVDLGGGRIMKKKKSITKELVHDVKYRK